MNLDMLRRFYISKVLNTKSSESIKINTIVIYEEIILLGYREHYKENQIYFLDKKMSLLSTIQHLSYLDPPDVLSLSLTSKSIRQACKTNVYFLKSVLRRYEVKNIKTNNFVKLWKKIVKYGCSYWETMTDLLKNEDAIHLALQLLPQLSKKFLTKNKTILSKSPYFYSHPNCYKSLKYYDWLLDEPVEKEVMMNKNVPMDILFKIVNKWPSNVFELVKSFCRNPNMTEKYAVKLLNMFTSSGFNDDRPRKQYAIIATLLKNEAMPIKFFASKFSIAMMSPRFKKILIARQDCTPDFVVENADCLSMCTVFHHKAFVPGFENIFHSSIWSPQQVRNYEQCEECNEKRKILDFLSNKRGKYIVDKSFPRLLKKAVDIYEQKNWALDIPTLPDFFSIDCFCRFIELCSKKERPVPGTFWKFVSIRSYLPLWFLEKYYNELDWSLLVSSKDMPRYFYYRFRSPLIKCIVANPKSLQ